MLNLPYFNKKKRVNNLIIRAIDIPVNFESVLMTMQ